MNSSPEVSIRHQWLALLRAVLFRICSASIPGIGIFLFASAAYAAGPVAYLTPEIATLSALPGATFQGGPGVIVEDANGDLVTGTSVTFTAPSSGASGTFSNGGHSITVVSSGGIARATFTANSIPGTYTVTAAALGANFQIISADFQFTNIGPAAITLTTDFPTQLTGGQIKLDAIVTDSAGQPVSGYLVTFSAPSSGPSGIMEESGSNAASVSTVSDGLARVHFTGNSVLGPFTVSAFVMTPTNTILTASINLDNVGQPSSVTPVPGATPQSQIESLLFVPLAVKVTDVINQPLAGITVTYQAPPLATGYVALTSTSAVTDASGIATVNAQAGYTSGAYQVFATTSGANTAVFNLTNVPVTMTPLPDTTPQSAPLGAYFRALAVKVLDPANHPVPGFSVNFSSPKVGATALPVFVSALTDGNGIASATVQAYGSAGPYAVTASNNVTGTSATFSLTNTVAAIGPAITQNPADVTVNAGATAQFTGAASGSPTPSVQWQQSTNGGAAFSDVAGATSTTLSFPAAAAQNGYQFRAVFQNATGIATTNAATLTVQTPAAITQNPANATVKAGATAQFTAAASGNPTPNVQWQQSTDAGSTFTNIAGATSATLSFTAALPQNGYRFRAVFTNSTGSATTTAATLTVQAQATCDPNGDGHTNTSDVQLIVNEALGVAPATNHLTLNGAVNVVDIQIETNTVLGLGCSITTGTATASNPSHQVAPMASGRNPNIDPVGLPLPHIVTELGSIGGLSTTAYGINNLGQIVGASGSRAFLWDAGRISAVDVPVDGKDTDSAAFSINDNGQIAGDYWYAGQQGGGFLYGAGHISLLSNVPESRVSAINNAGQIVGDLLRGSATRSSPFLWRAGTIRTLETWGGGGAHASAINDVGQVVGFAYVRDNSALHASLYDGVASRDLGTLGGTNSVAFGINAAGQVVGSSQTIDDRLQHAFLYSGGLMTDLGTLGGADSQADGINSRGLIVGWANTTNGEQHAFLLSGGRMLDLNSLASLGTEAVLVEATAINDVGQLIANGSDGRAYLITLPAQLQ